MKKCENCKHFFYDYSTGSSECGKYDNMKKLREYLIKWTDGQRVKGINVSLYDVEECIRVYNAIVRKEKPEFINGKVKEILDKCGIKTTTEGIGWRVV